MARAQKNLALREPAWVQWLLTIVALAFLVLFLVIPLITVFYEAFRQGLGVYWAAITEPDAQAAIRLTLLTVAIAVPINTLFGIAAAWAITKYRFRGKQFLTTLIDLPFAVSPIVAGLIYLLLYGAQGWWGEWLIDNDLRVVFAVPGIVLVVMFGTLPFVARELIPHMQEQGTDFEEAAVSLGASGLQTFFRVTLPAIKWSLLYGIILCNARAMGEFGAVTVVSGNIRGETNTMPLHVEVLYNEYQLAAAFAVASLLAGLALVTIVLKTAIEWKTERDRRLDELSFQAHYEASLQTQQQDPRP